jgi:uncharacterized protein YndB with AHSA1/START domain
MTGRLSAAKRVDGDHLAAVMSETVSFEREYAAPPDRVWAAWTELDPLTTWFGCGPGMLWNVHEWDARVGTR